MWQSWVNLIVSLWLVLCGFITGLQNGANLVISGIILAICGFMAYSTKKGWQVVVIGVVGLWLFVSGLVPTLVAQWNFIIAGLFCALLVLLYGFKKTEKAS